VDTVTHRFLITSAPGLQELLADELRGFGLDPEVDPSGAVVLNGGWGAATRVLIRSRIASRVLLSVRRFSSRTRAMLYDQVRRVDWPSVFPSERTMAVQSAGAIDTGDYALSYATLRIKDAVCDEFRKRGHLRPNVDRRAPDVLLNAFFHGGRCELSVDLTGAPLHRRGYRLEGAEAPLRENRAAALLLFSGYDGSAPFVDPFCGSGTLPIEAALIATRTAPGLLRKPEEFTLLKLFPDAAASLQGERERAAKERLDAPPHLIRGSDVSRGSLDKARGNAERAGVSAAIVWKRADALNLKARESWIVCNPPYGERLEDPESAAALLHEFASRVKHFGVGSTLALVVPRGALEKSVGLKPERRLAVESGDMGLRYLCFHIRAGKFTPAQDPS